MQFTYRALKDGKEINGVLEATSKEAAVSALVHQGIHPLSVKLGGKKGGMLTFGKPKVKLQDLVIFTRQLSTMVSAGVPLARSLATLGADSESPALKDAIQGIVKEVEGGAPLGDAFGKYPHIFSDVYVNMVRAGEEGGILDEILKRLALQVEMDASIRKKVKSAMAYPTVLLVVTFVAFFGIMLFIIPKISHILTDLGGPNAKLPKYTQVLLNFSNFCVQNTIIKHIPVLSLIPGLNKLPNLLFLAALAGVGGIYFIRYIRTDKGKYNFHLVLLKIPVVKTIMVKMAVARFSRTFASLMSAGVSVLDALDVTAGAIGNKVFERSLHNAASEVKNGKQLSEPIGSDKIWPPIVAQMLAVGEETGQIDTVLVKVADFYEEEVETLIDGLASIIEPVMIVILGGAVGLIAASVMGPIANLSKNIGS